MFSKLGNFSSKEKIFLLLSIVIGFLIAMDYAIVRPVSQSLFLANYGSEFLPYVWLVTLPFSLLCVALYNRLLPKVGCFALFTILSSMILVGNVSAALLIHKSPIFPFLFYMWKEVYILLMLQQLWSVIHATIPMQKAKYLYGILFGFGALGGGCGSLIPGLFAVSLGSERLLFMTIPLYLLLIPAYAYLLRYSSIEDKQVVKKQTSSFASLRQGSRLLLTSKLLLGIALMTAFMQITSALTEYQFQTFLQDLYPQKDVRTQSFARILCLGNMLTMSFQFLGTYLLVHYLGMKRTHLSVPLILALCALITLVAPTFGAISASFLLIKACDFSVFCVVKEMLYVPMRLEEKFQAKAIIDIFVYRASKVVASLVVMILQFFFVSKFLQVLSWLNLSIFLVWCLLILSLGRQYRDSAVELS